mmetsp:Transcript_28255/g.74108  ORF Transcript_28255/g.74108 Transcript_28255/m.74108 type:complete len:210 (+) Transcript_28255:334-963(+)
MADAGAAEDGGPEILHVGFLVKQGKIFKNWKNRWFVLYNDGKLRYFRKHPGGTGVPEVGTQAGTIDIRKVTELIKGEDVENFKWPCSDTRSCFAAVLPHRTYYLICRNSDEALDWQKVIGALAFDAPGDDGYIGAGIDDNAIEDDSEDDEEGDSKSAITLLSQALQANADGTSFERSESMMRGRLDTHCESMLKRESELVREAERRGDK